MSKQNSRLNRREQNRTNDPMTIRLSGPRISVHEPDSVHLISFSQLEFEHGAYYNSIPLSTADIKQLINAGLDWLGPEVERELLAARATALNLHLVGTGAKVDKPKPPEDFADWHDEQMRGCRP